MSNFNFYFVLITAALGATLPGSAYAQGGEGGGFNGPTLSPVSIPIHVDHQVTSEEALAAAKVCFATGDARRGVKSLLDRAYEGIFPGEGDPGHVEAKLLWTGGFLFDLDYFIGGWAMAGRGGQFRLSMEMVPIPQRRLEMTFNSDGTALPRSTRGPFESLILGNVLLVSNEPMPIVTYEKAHDEVTYDQWGRVATRQTLLQGLHLVAPGGARRMTFYNASTHRPIDLVLNLDEYIQCLQGEIQQVGPQQSSTR